MRDGRLIRQVQNRRGSADVPVDSRAGAVGCAAIAEVGDVGDLIEHAPAAADHQLAAGLGLEGKPEARSEIVQIAGPQRVEAMCADIGDAAVSGDEGRNQVLRIIDRALIHPVQAIVQGQLRSDLPGVLGEKRHLH